MPTPSLSTRSSTSRPRVPAEKYPRIPRSALGRFKSQKDYLRACLDGGPPPCSNFPDVSGPYIEALLVGDLAMRAGVGQEARMGWRQHAVHEHARAEPVREARVPARLGTLSGKNRCPLGISTRAKGSRDWTRSLCSCLADSCRGLAADWGLSRFSGSDAKRRPENGTVPLGSEIRTAPRIVRFLESVCFRRHFSESRFRWPCGGAGGSA